jgi:hypothetical protein
MSATLYGVYVGFISFFVIQLVQWWVWVILLCIGSVGIFRLERIRLVQESHQKGDLYAQPKDA